MSTVLVSAPYMIPFLDRFRPDLGKLWIGFDRPGNRGTPGRK